jgi:multidrug transporter EmrE-like cation transporter
MKQETTKLSAIIYVAIAAIFGSFGQIFYKYAANSTTNAATFILNPYLYFGVGLYGLGLIFMLKALRRGELTVIYPVMATSFICVSILSPMFFNTDSMSVQKWLGIAIIISGVTLVGKGRTK